MSGVIVFGFGVLVMLIVSAAVVLLLWGAANETEHPEVRPGASGEAPPSGGLRRAPGR